MVGIARLIVPIAFLVLGVIYVRETGNIRVLYDTGPVGPGDFPKALFAALVVAVIFVLIGEFRMRRASLPRLAPVDLAFVGAVVVACALYIVLFRRVGFVVSTALFAFTLLLVFARGRMGILMAAVYAAGITLAVYALFGLVFDVRLPPTPFLATLFEQGEQP